MTMPTPEAVRSKSTNVDSVFLRAVEAYRSSTPQPDVIKKIDDYAAEALLLIDEVIENVRAIDPEKNKDKSPEQLLADPEMTERFRERFAEVFQRKLNREASNVENGRIIEPAANLKSTLLGAIQHISAK